MKDFLISLVIPVFNEEKLIHNSLQVIHRILTQNNINHQFIMVDDGSRDRTWQEIKKVSQEIPGIIAIKLSRNFGKESALCAGLDNGDGDAYIVMDADLQHPPDIIPEMVRLWQNNGYDIVEGVKSSRGREKLVNKVGAGLFYKILQRLSGINLNMASDFKLLDAKVVTSWRLLKERNTFFRGMSAWVGFNRASIPFEVAPRKAGTTKWSNFQLFKLAINAITSYSSIPLQVITFLGIIFLIGAIPLGIETLYSKFQGIAVSGFTTVILLLLIIGSALMISLGIIGTYIAKIFDEVKYRPRYLVSETIGIDNSTGGK